MDHLSSNIRETETQEAALVGKRLDREEESLQERTMCLSQGCQGFRLPSNPRSCQGPSLSSSNWQFLVSKEPS